MLCCHNLSCSFGDKRAVEDINLALEKGAFVGIVGRSGAGKSTLLRLLNRLLAPTSGTVSWNGCDITSLRGRELQKWRANCAMIFQQYNLVERLDVLTNVLAGRLVHHGFVSSMLMRFSDEERAAGLRVLERFDLSEQVLQRAGTLSGGQQQRVAIARALMQAPQILLADEPIASLDQANATSVMNSLRTINRQDGITVLVNLHHIEVARAYCDTIVAMRDGHIVFQGPPDDLTKDLLGEIYGATPSEVSRHAADSNLISPAA